MSGFETGVANVIGGVSCALALEAAVPFLDEAEVAGPYQALQAVGGGETDLTTIEEARRGLLNGFRIIVGRADTPPGGVRYASVEAAVERLRKVIAIHEAAQNNGAGYRSEKLYWSGGTANAVLDIQHGISRTTPLRRGKIPTVLFFNFAPTWSNGSGTYSVAMAREIIAQGGHAAILFLGPRLDPTLTDVPQYLLPFKPLEGEALPGSANALLPVILSNATNPNGLKIRELSEPAMATYIDSIADALAVAAKHMGADAIVCNHAMVGAEAARRTGLPFVVACHGSCMTNVVEVQANPDRYAPSFLEATMRGVRAAGRITALSDEARLEFERIYGVPADRITTVWNGFDSKQFVRHPELKRNDVLQTLGIDPAGITHLVVYTGRMDEGKGIGDFLAAAPEIIQAIPGVHFVLAGGGAMSERYQQMARELGIADHLHFVGHQPVAKLVELNNVADLAFLLSHNEPFGIAPLEAAGTGTPVLVTRAGGLKDFVTADFGIFVEPKRPDQIRDAMVHALRTDLKGRIGKRAAEYVHQNHTWANSGRLLLQQLRLAIKERRQRAERRDQRRASVG